MRTTRVLLPLVLLALLAVPAHADDDPATLLTLGRAAETTSRDYPRALDLFRRAFEAGSHEKSLEAGFALERLQEEMGQNEAALQTLTQIMERFGDRLKDLGKRTVHQAMQRVLPPGVRGRSPLGEVVGVPRQPDAPTRQASPLDEKIRNLVARIDNVDPGQQNLVVQQIQNAVVPVGKEALPVLEGLMYGEHPARADVAAALYARIGGVDAIEGLERAAANGDGFTRAAALRAMKDLAWSVSNSDGAPKARVVALLDRLRANERLATWHNELRDHQRGLVPREALLERHLRGGPDAGFWLETALRTRAPGALERALDLARAGGDDGRAAIGALFPLVFPQEGVQPTYPPETLSVEARRSFLETLMATQEPNPTAIARILQTLAAGGSDAVDPLVERAWRLLEAPSSQARRQYVGQALLKSRLLPPRALFAESGWSKAYFQFRADSQNLDPNLPEPVDDARYWDGLFRALPELTPEFQKRLLHSYGMYFGYSRTLPPREQDARWLSWIRPQFVALGVGNGPPFLLQVGARSGRPEFLEALKAARPEWGANGRTWLQTLKDYEGPGLLGYVRELLRDASVPGDLTGLLLQLLAEDTGPEGKEEILAIIRDWKHPRAVQALQWAGRVVTDDEVAQLGRRVTEAAEPPSIPYREALIQIARTRHLKAAVPYLLWEFKREDVNEAAGKALDAIRAYHDKIAEFEAWAKER